MHNRCNCTWSMIQPKIPISPRGPRSNIALQCRIVTVNTILILFTTGVKYWKKCYKIGIVCLLFYYSR